MQNVKSQLKIQNLKSKLPSEIFRLMKLIGKEADSIGYKAFCVGGFVRDLFLDVKNLDIDVVIEQNAMRLARIIAKKLNGSLVTHKKFGTASVYYQKGLKIDFATARTEKYAYPAALPSVNFSCIEHDLRRRDFTINAMAICINRKNFGDLVDFFRGRHDLKTKKIRALHDMSFIEDPTRIFRAVRFEQRLNFHIEPHTKALINDAVKRNVIAKTQNQRLRDELILILSEHKPIEAILRMGQLHELRFISPDLKLSRHTLMLIKAATDVCNRQMARLIGKKDMHPWIIYFMALINSLSLDAAVSVCAKFVFKKKDRESIIGSKKTASKIATLLDTKKDMKPSGIYYLLKPLSYETILFIMAKTKTKKAKKRIALFFTRYNSAKISVNGSDLKKIGLRPGPLYKKILNKIFSAKLDGRAKRKKDQMDLAVNYIS